MDKNSEIKFVVGKWGIEPQPKRTPNQKHNSYASHFYVEQNMVSATAACGNRMLIEDFEEDEQMPRCEKCLLFSKSRP